MKSVEEKKKVRAKIEELLSQGHLAPKIAERLAIPVSTVYYVSKKLGKNGSKKPTVSVRVSEPVAETSSDAATIPNLIKKLRDVADFAEKVVVAQKEKAEQLFL